MSCHSPAYGPLTVSALLARRLKELKAALAARSGDTPTACASPTIPAGPSHLASSGSTLASDPLPDRAGPSSSNRLGIHAISTPDAASGPARSRILSAQPSVVHAPTQEEGDIPLRPPTRVQNIPSNRPRRMPTPPPDIDDADIAMAEDFDPRDQGYYTQQEHPPEIDELVPPSSPLPVTPSRPPVYARPRQPASPTSRQLSARESRAAAIAAVQDIPADAIFSSPAQQAPVKLPRTENSTTRTIGNGAEAGPSQIHPLSSQTRSVKPTTYKAGTQASQAPKPVGSSQASGTGVQAPRTVVAEKRFPWSKEVDDKLRTYFQKPKFRFHQKEAIDETMAGKDGELATRAFCCVKLTAVFVLMPTGGGKSLTCELI